MRIGHAIDIRHEESGLGAVDAGLYRADLSEVPIWVLVPAWAGGADHPTTYHRAVPDRRRASRRSRSLSDAVRIMAGRAAVLVLNRERPVYVIVNPQDHPAVARATRRGRPLREAVRLLAETALPDPAFGEDMEAILATAGSGPVDPWARS